MLACAPVVPFAASHHPTIPGFQILEKLSEGGMGEVFLAHRVSAPGLVVLKTLLPEMGAEPAVVERFFREAEIASRLNHKNIARLEHADMTDGRLFLAFEYVAGVDFFTLFSSAKMSKENVSERALLTLGVQLLAALAYAHELADDDGVYLGLVHRDLAPPNLMVTFDGAAKIIDFGLAHASLGDFRTESGMVLGTLRYASPEQARGEPIDARSDLYTLGLVLLEGLIGEPVIPHNPGGEIWSLIERAPAPRLSDRRPDIPPALSAFFDRALAKDRNARYPSAAAMRKALEDAALDLVNADDEELAEEIQRLAPEAYEKTVRLFEAFEELAEVDAVPSGLEATRTLPEAAPAEDAEDSERPRTKAERPRARDVEISALVVSSRMIEPLSGTRDDRRPVKEEDLSPVASPPAPPAANAAAVRDLSIGDVRPRREPIARTPPLRARGRRRPMFVFALVLLGLLTCFAIGTGAYYATEYFVTAAVHR